MDRVNKYSQLIEGILERYAQIPYSHGDITSYVITDAPKNHFML